MYIILNFSSEGGFCFSWKVLLNLAGNSDSDVMYWCKYRPVYFYIFCENASDR